MIATGLRWRAYHRESVGKNAVRAARSPPDSYGVVVSRYLLRGQAMPVFPTQPGFSEDASTAELIRRLLVYLGRALRLRCPECGVSPVFVPARKTRSVRDWVTPLDGCPR